MFKAKVADAPEAGAQGAGAQGAGAQGTSTRKRYKADGAGDQDVEPLLVSYAQTTSTTLQAKKTMVHKVMGQCVDNAYQLAANVVFVTNMRNALDRGGCTDGLSVNTDTIMAKLWAYTDTSNPPKDTIPYMDALVESVYTYFSNTLAAEIEAAAKKLHADTSGVDTTVNRIKKSVDHFRTAVSRASNDVTTRIQQLVLLYTEASLIRNPRAGGSAPVRPDGMSDANWISKLEGDISKTCAIDRPGAESGGDNDDSGPAPESSAHVINDLKLAVKAYKTYMKQLNASESAARAQQLAEKYEWDGILRTAESLLLPIDKNLRTQRSGETTAVYIPAAVNEAIQ
jgi:hypothetical protein